MTRRFNLQAIITLTVQSSNANYKLCMTLKQGKKFVAVCMIIIKNLQKRVVTLNAFFSLNSN